MTIFHQQSHKLDKVNSQAGGGVIWVLGIIFTAVFLHMLDAGSATSVSAPVHLWQSTVSGSGWVDPDYRRPHTQYQKNMNEDEQTHSLLNMFNW